MTVNFDDIKNFLTSRNPSAEIININIDDIIFEERIKLRCYYCSKYNTKWTCPPRIPDLNFPQIIGEYKNAAIISLSIDFDKDSFEKARRDSSITLHRLILELESFLFNHNNVTYNSFIGGSCKLCKNGCDSEKCKNPGLARIPLEATGMNIVETMKNYGVEIVFPPTKKISEKQP